MKSKSEYSETFKVEKEDCISDINSLLPSVLGTYIIVNIGIFHWFVQLKD